MMLRVRYFASLRERMGLAEETLTLSSAAAFDELLAELRSRHGERADCLIGDKVRVAVNQQLVEGAIELKDGDELGFLPPVTGG